MRLGAIIPQGNFSADTWIKIYENELETAQTSVTISGLDGNTDVMYRLIVRQIGNVPSARTHFRLNNDTGSNYGHQWVIGSASTATASRDIATTVAMGLAASGEVSQGEAVICAKSGYIRTLLLSYNDQINGTTVNAIFLRGNVWNNTSDNITSIVVLADVASGLGINTLIELWKPVPKV